MWLKLTGQSLCRLTLRQGWQEDGPGQDADDWAFLRVLLGSRWEFADGEAFTGFEVAFAAEPVFHGGVKAIEGDVVAGFEEAVGDGESVVEDGVIGEVAHGEVVDPMEGTGGWGAVRGDTVDRDFTDEHVSTVKHGRMEGVCVCELMFPMSTFGRLKTSFEGRVERERGALGLGR
jgi:hypothetical protein